jgi:hypothetical protein
MFTGPSAVNDFTDRGLAYYTAFKLTATREEFIPAISPSAQPLPCKLTPLRKVLLFVEKVSGDKQVTQTSIKKCLVNSLVPQRQPMSRPWTRPPHKHRYFHHTMIPEHLRAANYHSLDHRKLCRVLHPQFTSPLNLLGLSTNGPIPIRPVITEHNQKTQGRLQVEDVADFGEDC